MLCRQNKREDRVREGKGDERLKEIERLRQRHMNSWSK